MLSMGSSRPWPDAMQALTGQRRMSAQPLLNYFQPLTNWLEEENRRNKEMIGWDTSASKSASLATYSQLSLLTLGVVISWYWL